MAVPFKKCLSCGKPNMTEDRYCISCGSLLTPVYCSSCGTPNPEGLKQCVQCGNAIPTLTTLRWNPIVTVLQPTSAMSGENISIIGGEGQTNVPEQPEPQPKPKGLWSRIRRKRTEI